MSEPSVSVVVPAFNCEKTIARCIECILAQSHPADEIILVDDGSVDKTSEIIRTFKTVKYLYQSNAGPASARNLGGKEARGEFIFFTDSDCLPDKNWIDRSVKHFQKPGVAVVSGSYGISNPKSRLARCIHQEILFRHRHLMPTYPKSFGSFNFGIRREVFRQVGGFNESYRQASGEDNDLSYKILKQGLRIYFEPESTVDHFHPTRMYRYLKEQFRHGFWRVKMYKLHPLMAKGDDYTFWKDIAEIPMAMFILLFLILSLYSQSFFVLWGTLSVLLFAVELYFSKVALKRWDDCIYSAFVFFLRSFARAFGFLTGIFFFFILKLEKKSN
ncbi:MAG: glycosyltransferase family 2 protein [Candidatus Omnitrophota bacterium]